MENVGTQPKGKKLTGIICIIISALGWSTIGMTSKLLDWNAMAMTGVRGGMGAIMLLIYMKLRKKRVIISKKSLLVGCLISITSFIFMAANKLTTAANAIVLQYTSPIFLMVFSALILKKHFRRMDIMAVGFTVLGIVLFFVDKLTPGGMLGNVLAIVDGACLAMMYLVTGEIDEETRLSGILTGAVISFMVGGPVALFTVQQVDVRALAVLALMGALQIAIPYAAYSTALKSCPPLACSLIGSVELILSPLWALLILGEIPGRWALVGGAIIIIMLTVWCILDAKYDAKSKPVEQATGSEA